jgi:hypothetical protein
MVQARDAKGKVLGTFSSAENHRLMECSPTEASSISHSNNDPKSKVELQWKVPEHLDKGTKVYFHATIVEEFEKFFRLTKPIVA